MKEKQPFGVHLMTFADNPQKCKGVAFITYVDANFAKASIKKLSGLCLNESKPNLKLSCELNTRKQAQEWKPPLKPVSHSSLVEMTILVAEKGKKKKAGTRNTAIAVEDTVKIRQHVQLSAFAIDVRGQVT